MHNQSDRRIGLAMCPVTPVKPVGPVLKHWVEDAVIRYLNRKSARTDAP
ncbi:hypothetical protein L195_g004418 [Trifolium pratense]|uniref:Uncharacterized protein n=1 Tax=Trifolium pratense TaxID=57577 RepID=A0A2K3NXZ5_TRIPR|nr:hypothetical protein L195_g004418 [Trifolium pratense]